jgi:succinyl-CoA synthetase beta subunit
VVKAQVHAGGRGKAGGVKVAKDLGHGALGHQGHARHHAGDPSDGSRGLPVHQVYVETGSKIVREIYLSLVLNREAGRIAFVVSSAGGMDIEEVAEHTPEKLISINVHPTAGLQDYQCRQLAFALELDRRANRAVRQDRACAVQAVLGAAMPRWWRSIR